MKKNVYDQVNVFYEEFTEWETIIKQEWVEGFLRQKAWQGIDDTKLKSLWHSIQIFIKYLTHAGNEDITELTVPEYHMAVEFFMDFIDGFKPSLKNVRNFFAVLQDFFQYLNSRKIIEDCHVETVRQAAQEIAGGKRLMLMRADVLWDEVNMLEDGMNFSSDIHGNLGHMISEITESLMIKLGKYFHRDEFMDDFERALYLYMGPFERDTGQADDEFWLGFWDYFLFDYHLLVSDQHLLEYFYDQCSSQLSHDELQILKELLRSKFTVFYVSKIINPDMMECVNLFTGEVFGLPVLDFGYKELKKLLFFGHIFPTGLVMINYLTSMVTSVNLRRRIRDEVLRQMEIFKVQAPEAKLDDFFRRHALTVRHTINSLVSLNKVNVTPITQLEREFPEISERVQPDAKVVVQLYKIAAEEGFSRHDKYLLEKMWSDYSQLQPQTVRKALLWAVAVVLAYAQVNNTGHNLSGDLAKKYGLSETSLKKNITQLQKVLQLQIFDARYLSEEGFVISLFES